eukprot:scaffold125608_cov36-Phaeocystis_antarctica.AAC.1
MPLHEGERERGGGCEQARRQLAQRRRRAPRQLDAHATARFARRGARFRLERAGAAEPGAYLRGHAVGGEEAWSWGWIARRTYMVRGCSSHVR